MYILRQSTERIIRVGPFVDVTDMFTPEAAVALTGGGDPADEAELLKTAGAATVDISANTWAAITGSDGWYNLTLTTGNTDTLGDVKVVVQNDSLHLPVHVSGVVIPAPVYDALFAGSGYLQTDLLQIGGDTQSAADLKDFADAGYDPSTNQVEGVKLVDTTTANTDMVAEAPTVAQIWQALIATHAGVVGSVAEALNAVGTPATPAAIAAAVLLASGATAEATAGDDTLAAAMALLLNKKTMSGNYLVVYKRDGITEFFRILLTTDSDAEPVVGTGAST